MRSFLLVIGTSMVLALNGCLVAAGVAATSALTGGAGAANRWLGAKLVFDSVEMVKAKPRAGKPDSIFVRGLITYKRSKPGFDKGKDAFYPLPPGAMYGMELIGESGAVLTGNLDPIMVWDGKEQVTALPKDRALRFEIRSELPHNVWLATHEVRMKNVTFGVAQ